jgi:hypothetical protein
LHRERESRVPSWFDSLIHLVPLIRSFRTCMMCVFLGASGLLLPYPTWNIVFFQSFLGQVAICLVFPARLWITCKALCRLFVLLSGTAGPHLCIVGLKNFLPLLGPHPPSLVIIYPYFWSPLQTDMSKDPLVFLFPLSFFKKLM